MEAAVGKMSPVLFRTAPSGKGSDATGPGGYGAISFTGPRGYVPLPGAQVHLDAWIDPVLHYWTISAITLNLGAAGTLRLGIRSDSFLNTGAPEQGGLTNSVQNAIIDLAFRFLPAPVDSGPTGPPEHPGIP